MNKTANLKAMNQALQALIEVEANWLTNLANSTALLMQFMDDINWAGYYIWQQGELVLGPFQGKTACVRIAAGQGVCGTAYSEKKVQLVEDVCQFEGHIACDPDSRSELVIPVIVAGEVIAVLDLDSPQLGRFDEVDKNYLLEFIKILITETDFLPLLNNK
ncbi:GAF domain-containing protein [Halanaerobium salsuginis]|uniref:GAF domain-containing protein n=1 Tax=Halanaerobium salsuginis TaxID=29563 RepID=A0A1I4M071_9FIRM|nr:GAF domain-containing protein [Halanaerobium salsuginis]SFL96609.1 GAF domain-containing protein [Halanaerobium salsuginis]